jgi:hypothetical protein
MELIRSEPKEYSLPVYSNALLNKVVRLMDDQTFNPEEVVEKLKKSSIMDLQNYLLFTEEEQNTFEHALCKYAEDIEGIAKSVIFNLYLFTFISLIHIFTSSPIAPYLKWLNIFTNGLQKQLGTKLNLRKIIDLKSDTININ